MLIILDNAESILDPQGTDAPGIYAMVEELSRFSNICICVTSRISTTPPDCKRLDIPTLSTDAACRTFYRIHDDDDQPDLINDILEQLDFHPLSVTLLATVAHQNKWDNNRLAREWEQHQTGVFQTEHNKSLAATIELSLASPMLQELGPDARALLGVVAFFPQGVDENNVDRLFPTISNGTNVFDKFCILSLTYRSNGFIRMLAPLRDYLSPKDPKSSPLLCTTKEHYFTRMSVNPDPDKPEFGETRWITSEDVNVEHLLDIFTSISAGSGDVWNSCENFMEHLYWHKPRLTVLGPKIEGLPDDHPSKPECLFGLSRLFQSVGNHVERKRLLSNALQLWRERGNDYRVAQALGCLSDVNRLKCLHKEGVRLVKGALEILERLGDTMAQAECFIDLARLLYSDKQLDAASRAIDLFSAKDDRYLACQCHRVLGRIFHSKGERERAINHFESALGMASSSNWHDELFWVHYSLAQLLLAEGRLKNGHTHVEQAKLHAVDIAYYLGCAMHLQASFWCNQHRFEEAKSEVLRAVEVFEKLGAVQDLEGCGELLQRIEERMNNPVALFFNGELPETVTTFYAY